MNTTANRATAAASALVLILVLCSQGCLHLLMAQGALMTAGVVGMAVDKATTEENETTAVEASWDEWEEEQRRMDERMGKRPNAPVEIRNPEDGALEAEIFYPGALEEHPAVLRHDPRSVGGRPAEYRRNPEAGSLSDMVDPLYAPPAESESERE